MKAIYSMLIVHKPNEDGRKVRRRECSPPDDGRIDKI